MAVIDAYASPTIASDIQTYSSLHGLPSTNGLFRQVVAPGTFNRPQNPRQNPQGWSGEETLDVEAVHTMAPGAAIVYVGAPNNYQDLDAAMNHVVDQHLADIVTNSYGFASEALPPGYIKPLNDTLIQAAAEGISVLFSSGDNGDETGGVAGASPTPDWPASSPGSLQSAAPRSVSPQPTAASSSSAGRPLGPGSPQAPRGVRRPTCTAPVGVPAGCSRSRPTRPGSCRTRSPRRTAARRCAWFRMSRRWVTRQTGMLVGQTQRFPDGTDKYAEYRIGGTSLSSPLMAGMLADAVQNRGAALGLANPALYAAADTSAYNDITKADLPTYPGAVRSDYVNGVDASGGYSYTARYFDQDGALTIHVQPGYDDVTGVGSPNGGAWLAALS